MTRRGCSASFWKEMTTMVPTPLLPLSRRALLAAVAAQAWLDRAAAQTAERWPSRPIRVIVPNPPGGPGDTVFRLLAPVVGATLGQPLTMDHRPGAGNTIGTALTARSVPDGYGSVQVRA
jgi:tripartite-type tricarboxylate transporter receptor subunit TctC